MIVILSSSKTQMVTPVPCAPSSKPPLLNQAKPLIERCRELSHTELTTLMKISDKLAQTTYERFQQFSSPQIPGSAGAALASFRGDVFSEIKTESYSAEDFVFAHHNLCILSGLYGILRPLDLMQPYRLEMGQRLAIHRSRSLYEFWGEMITDHLNQAMLQHEEQTLINCASKEYSRAVKENKLNGKMLTMTFKQHKDGKLKTIALYAKRARGMFVDWFIRKRITDSKDLRTFNGAGYRFRPELSTESEYLFVSDFS
jgi:cytoplasmic iron level regulating protein YaaA (DUF328/UPF0246 family)